MLALVVVLVMTSFGFIENAQAESPDNVNYAIKAGDKLLAVTGNAKDAYNAIYNAKTLYKKPFSYVSSVKITPELEVVPFDADKYYKSCTVRDSVEAGRWIYTQGRRSKSPFKIVVKGTIYKSYKNKYKTKTVKVKSWSTSKRKVVQTGRNGYAKYRYRNSESVNGRVRRGTGKCVERKKSRTKIVKKGTKSSKRVVKYAKNFLGCPYVYGGNSLRYGTDCSGFVKGVYKRFGYNLPRTSGGMRSVGRGVSYKNAKSGDILCYSGHVAIYMGGGRIIHAAGPGQGITTGPARYARILTVRRVM